MTLLPCLLYKSFFYELVSVDHRKSSNSPVASRRQWAVVGRLPDTPSGPVTRCGPWCCHSADGGSRCRAAPPQSAGGAGWAPRGSGSLYTCTVRCQSPARGQCTVWPLGQVCGTPLGLKTIELLRKFSLNIYILPCTKNVKVWKKGEHQKLKLWSGSTLMFWAKVNLSTKVH